MTDVPAPNNQDGRYYWTGNAAGVTGGQINFVGDPTLLLGTASLTWTIKQRASDGSYPIVTYSTASDGSNPQSTQVGSEGTPQEVINESGQIDVSLVSATGFIVNVTSGGGSVIAGAKPWILAVAITRNANESIPWDYPNPLNPLNYNGSFNDLSGNPDTDTLANLRQQLMIDLGFASQAANPTPGMKLFCNQKLQSAQRYLYRRYMALATRRFFRWKLIPGQRFYSFKDNDEAALSQFHLDPNKTIEWVGCQDTRNVWYPVIAGIPPEVYTMEQTPWRPARYDIKGCLEIYPAPDQTYFLWVRGHFGLLSFVNDDDYTTINSDVVYLHALANAKAHYGQPDANNIESQANAYRGELVAATHKTRRYIPGTTPLPPAVRPTLLHFIGGGPS